MNPPQLTRMGVKLVGGGFSVMKTLPALDGLAAAVTVVNGKLTFTLGEVGGPSMRLCRRMCRRPVAFRQHVEKTWGYAP